MCRQRSPQRRISSTEGAGVGVLTCCQLGLDLDKEVVASYLSTFTFRSLRSV